MQILLLIVVVIVGAIGLAIAVPRLRAKNTLAAMKKEAANGNPLAQYSLAGLYFDGLGVPRNYSQAAFWFSKAAEKWDNIGVQFKLGILYRYGVGVRRDDTQAAAWFRKVAEEQRIRGIAFIMLAMGGPDYAEAYFWFDLAAASEPDESMAKTYAKYRDEEISPRLTPIELARARERVRKFAHCATNS